MLDEANALAPMTGFFNNPLEGGVILETANREKRRRIANRP